MSNLTAQEKHVFNTILHICYWNHGAAQSNISQVSKMPFEGIRGIVYSLAEKGMVTYTEREGKVDVNGNGFVVINTKHVSVHPILNGKSAAFGIRTHERAEYFSHELK